MDYLIDTMDNKYEQLETIGRGNFGEVYKCRDREKNTFASMKRILFRYQDDGVPGSVIRGVALLKELDHPNIISLLDVLDDEKWVDLVFEYLEMDLWRFMGTYPRIGKDPNLTKSFLYQILSDSYRILHRNLKPRNIMVDVDKKIVKIADYGLARPVDAPVAFTYQVLSPGYKAPELLIDAKYSTPVDIWSVGCIFAEMVTHHPLFNGQCEHTAIMEMFSLLGVPNVETWPGVTSLGINLSNPEALVSGVRRSLSDVVKGLEPTGIDLLAQMLCLNPCRRITARDALIHAYFRNA
ncbi:Cell division control protein [Actinidia chinensis var. chinensis]|uniref:cyclin-dependent kinase n=1 Tax=Actinidia chinensis var. chinensis TaxID=1590841 RepID=A0A2R6PKW6_ACTCC|nr:Cell division control protein [Actinidia chinensis var. chinensis]